MYAVIKTGGKQYRVQPGDLLVVEKLDGEVGAELSFDQVLMVAGDGGEITVGAPLVEGARVNATLIETRKGEKVKIFKKIRRQGYRRTRGHRQLESVLRVTGLEGAGLKAAWDGTVDLTPLSVLNARARGLAAHAAEPVVAPAPAPKAKAPAKAKAAPAPVEAAPAAEEAAPAPKAKAAAKLAPPATAEG
jgi:large subunit ribosomal protein L21